MKNIILLILLCVPFLMRGEVLFADGMTWRTEIYGTHNPQPVVSIEVVSIEKTEEENRFNMYRYREGKDDRMLIAIIKTEDSKVFFKRTKTEDSDWYLMYDFGLEPGEGCYVNDLTDNHEPYKTYVKCVGIDSSSEGGEYRVMSLEEYRDDTCTDLMGNGSWLKGLSSLRGILFNNRFDFDGMCSNLIEVSENGHVLYSTGHAGIREVSGSSSPTIRVEGQDIYISVNDEIDGSIFTQSGEHIGTYRLDKTPRHITLASGGVYILQIGDFSQKILIP